MSPDKDGSIYYVGGNAVINLQITKKDLTVIVAIGIVIALFHMIGLRVLGNAIVGLELGGLTAGILFLFLRFYRTLDQRVRELQKSNRKMHYRTQKMQTNHFKQLEALLSLFSTLNPQVPFPDTGGMAASPDLLKKISEIIYQKQPDLIVEASSGVSTLVAAYCLKNLGKGKIISLEHEQKYAAISQELIETHGLEDIATVVHAPLKEFEIRERQWLWYDMSSIPLDKPIDVLLVDGPPDKIQKLARYPALPLLFDKLDHEGVILLDDGHRPDERESVKLWVEEFNGLQYEYLPFEKGAYILRMNAGTREQ